MSVIYFVALYLSACDGNPYAYCRAQPNCTAGICQPMPPPYQNMTCKCDPRGLHCACYAGQFPLCAGGNWQCN